MSDKNFKVKNGIDAAGKLTITNTSGTDSLIEVNGAGGGQFTITPYGGISTNAGFQSIGGPSYFGGYGGTTSIVVNVTGASGQTGDLQRWTTFDGTVLAKVDSTGSISATDLTLSGNLTVNGTTTNLNSTNLIIEDKNIIIADVATPTDTTADGAGITIKGATDKTFNWVQSTGSFTSSEDLIISKTLNPRLKIIDQTDGYTAGIDFITNRPGYSNVTSKIFFDFYGTSSIQTITGNGGHGMHYVSGRSSFGNHWFRKSTTDGVQMVILDFGNVGINSISPTGTLQVNNLNSSTVGLIVKAVSTQTANLQEWQDSTGTVLTKIDNNAGFYAQYIEAKNTAGILSSGESQIKIASPDGLKDIRFWNRNDAGGLYYYNSSGGSKNILRIAHSTDPRVVTQTWQDFTSGNSANYGGRVNIDTSTTTAIGMVIRGVASQTANLQEWQNSSGTALSYITKDGTLDLRNTSASSLTNSNSGTVGPKIDLWGGQYGIGLESGRTTAFFPSSGGFSFRKDSSSGTSIVDIPYSGLVGFNKFAQTSAQVWINNSTAANIGLIVQGAASQTADLQQWQNNAGTTLSKVDASGNITAPSYNLSDSKYLLRKTIKKTVDPAGNAIANNTYDLFDMDFPLSLQGTFYIQASIRGPGYGQNLTYSLPATYVMDWINQYPITNPFTNSTTWVDLTPLTFSPRHLMTNDYFKFQAKVNLNQISFRIKLTGTLTGSPVFDIYIQHSEEFANSTITELNTTGTDATTSNVMPNSLSSKAGLSAIFNPITLYSNSASNTPLTVKGFASQTADILQIQDSSGTTRVSFERGGALSVQPSTALNGYAGFFKSPSSVVVGLMVRGASSQTANLQEWQNSAGTALAKVDSSGSITAVDLTLSGNLTVNGTTTNLNSTNLVIEDKNIILADVATPTDTTADGGGITLKGATDKTIAWSNTSKMWESSDGFKIISASSSIPALITQPAVGQTASIQEWRDSLGNIIAKIGPLYGSNVFQFDPFSYGPGAGYSSIFIGGRGISNEQRAAQSKFGVTTGEWVLGALRSTDNQVGVFGTTTTLPTFTVKSVASQSANLQEWQDSGGNILSRVGADGRFYSTQIDVAHVNASSQIRGTYEVYAGAAGPLGALSAKSWVSNIVTIVARGAASQTANLQEWQNSSGTVLANVDSNGKIAAPIFQSTIAGTAYIVTGSNNNAIRVQTNGTANVGLQVRGETSQTANLQEWQNSAGTVLAQIDAAGNAVFNNASTTNNINAFYGKISANTQGSGFLGQISAIATSASTIGMVIRGAASQTANLQEWQNSSGTVLAKVDANGNFSAISKSFDIPHPTKENMRLRYASLEGPENGVYIRGTVESNIIELPEYWTGLVYEDSITVSLTAVGSAQNIYVEKIENNKVYIGGEFTKAFFTVYGERKDIDKLTVEY